MDFTFFAFCSWSTFDKRVVVTAHGQAMVVQDPDLKQGLVLYNAREALRTEFARTWVPEQSVAPDDRDWSTVVDQYVMPCLTHD